VSQCKQKVIQQGSISWTRCKRNAATLAGFCKQHDPVLWQAREKERLEKYRQQLRQSEKFKIDNTYIAWRITALNAPCSICGAKKGKPCKLDLASTIKIGDWSPKDQPMVHLNRFQEIVKK